MRERLLKDESGFTLTELMVTIMVMLTVLFGLYSIFDMSIRVFSFGNSEVEAVENARLGLAKMERDIRGAYPYDKTDNDSTNDYLFPNFTSSPSNTIKFGHDLNGDSKVTAPGEEIVYKLSGTAPYSLLRVSPSNAAVPDPVVEYVKANGLTFEYLKEDGTTATSEADIEIVRIKLDVEVKRGPQAGTQTLTTDVALRNRMK